jgi:hypothetical protein
VLPSSGTMHVVPSSPPRASYTGYSSEEVAPTPDAGHPSSPPHAALQLSASTLSITDSQPLHVPPLVHYVRQPFFVGQQCGCSQLRPLALPAPYDDMYIWLPASDGPPWHDTAGVLYSDPPELHAQASDAATSFTSPLLTHLALWLVEAHHLVDCKPLTGDCLFNRDAVYRHLYMCFKRSTVLSSLDAAHLG